MKSVAFNIKTGRTEIINWPGIMKHKWFRKMEQFVFSSCLNKVWKDLEYKLVFIPGYVTFWNGKKII